MKIVTIYTDGACANNPGKGGWAAVLRYGNTVREICGFDPESTNNKMEMTAAIKALESLREPCRVVLYTDSAYLRNAFVEGWLDRWKAKGWSTSSNRPVKNRDLWERLIELCNIHEVEWFKVKGHSGDPMNDRCDTLAVAAIQYQSNLDRRYYAN